MRTSFLVELHASLLSYLISMWKQFSIRQSFVMSPTLMLISLFAITPVLQAQPQSKVEMPHQTTESSADSSVKAAVVQKDDKSTTEEDSTEWESVTYNIYEPGRGYLVGKAKDGELWISAYALWRYVNQLPVDQSFTDHLGRQYKIDTRQDLQWHRVMVHFRGYAFSPNLNYVVTVWNVLSQQVMYIVGALTYKFSNKFVLSVGIDGLPGTRSLLGSHPLWLANDRVMSDDFLRPGFSSGIAATGEILPRFHYKVVINNNLSQINILLSQMTRDLAAGATVWWQPTTGEFGPRGAYGDWEYHEKLATRFGVSTGGMREDRYNPVSVPSPGSTQIRLADSILLFETGALADGVTVEKANYRILSFDAGIKYHGIFLQSEFSTRWLNDFLANGPLPVSSIVDQGLYLQTAFFPIRKKLELYASTSHIFGDKDAGFSNSYEYLGGANFYPFNTRYFRVNAQMMYVNRSPASSTFGFYVGGQKGTIITFATSLFF